MYGIWLLVVFTTRPQGTGFYRKSGSRANTHEDTSIQTPDFNVWNSIHICKPLFYNTSATLPEGILRRSARKKQNHWQRLRKIYTWTFCPESGPLKKQYSYAESTIMLCDLSVCLKCGWCIWHNPIFIILICKFGICPISFDVIVLPLNYS